MASGQQHFCPPQSQLVKKSQTTPNRALQNKWPGIFKSVKVMRVKGRWGAAPEETKETGQLNTPRRVVPSQKGRFNIQHY